MLHKYLSPLFFGSLCGLMLAFPALTAQSAHAALTMCSRRVVPPLFVFSVCAQMLTQGRRLPPAGLYALSFLGGSPAGAHLFDGADLTRRQSRRAAAVTGVMSPLYFLSTLPAAGMENTHRLWLIHLLAACAMLLIFPGDKAAFWLTLPARTLTDALQKSALSMLFVCACVTFFSVIPALLACALPLRSHAVSCLHALLEAAGGCLSARALSPVALSFFCAFGGLSILLQNAAVWHKHGLSTRFLLLAGLLRGAVAATFSLFLIH